MFFGLFWWLTSKIIFLKNNIYYFDAFPNEKHFEKQLLLHSWTSHRNDNGDQNWWLIIEKQTKNNEYF